MLRNVFGGRLLKQISSRAAQIANIPHFFHRGLIAFTSVTLPLVRRSNTIVGPGLKSRSTAGRLDLVRHRYRRPAEGGNRLILDCHYSGLGIYGLDGAHTVAASLPLPRSRTLLQSLCPFGGAHLAIHHSAVTAKIGFL